MIRLRIPNLPENVWREATSPVMAKAARLDLDQKIHFKAESRTVEIEYPMRTAREKYPEFMACICQKILSHEIMEQFATDEYRAEIEAGLEEARDSFRAGFANKVASDPDPQLDGMNTTAATAATLAGNDGMCLGHGHGDGKDARFLVSNLDDGTFERNNVGIIFIEEIKTWLQEDIDAFLTNPGAEMSPALSDALSHVQGGDAYRQVLTKAKEKGIRVYGIDAGEAEPGVRSDDARYPERRAVAMNKVSADVIKKARQAHPGAKFVATCGKAHANTHDGGIPGIAQICGIPVVTMDDQGGLAVEREDVTKRGMATKQTAKFRDEFVRRVYEGSFPGDKSAGKIRKTADALASQLVAAGDLTPEACADKAAFERLFGKAPVKDALVECQAFNKLATGGESSMKEEFEKRIGKKDTAGCLEILEAAPNLALQLDTQGKSTPLLLATQAGMLDVVKSLVRLGADVDAVNHGGDTALHIAKWNGEDAIAQWLAAQGAKDDLENRRGVKARDAMPDRKEREFIDAFIAAAFAEYPKGEPKPGEIPRDWFSVKDLHAKARDAVAALKRHGTFGSEDVPALLKRKRVKRRLDPIVESTKNRPAKRNELTEAVASGKTDDVSRIIAAHPELVEDTLVDQLKQAAEKGDIDRLKTILDAQPRLRDVVVDSTLGATALHIACKEGHDAVVKELIRRNVDLNATDSQGNTALHAVFSQRADGGKDRKAEDYDEYCQNRRDARLAVAKRLVAAGADVDAERADRGTSLHLAALNDYPQGIEYLIDEHADTTKQDSRGWTAQDVAVASTKVAAEAAFIAKGADNDELVGEREQLSTVDVLCRATKCENPAHAAKVREAYEKLYADPTFRPVLQLIALDAAGKRQPPDGGARIFIADHKQVGQLYNANDKARSPQGAYDEGANVVHIGGESEGHFTGVLAHELTHLSTHIMHGDSVVPFDSASDVERKKYVRAIEEDVRRMNLMNNASELEKKVREVVSTKIARDYKSDDAFLQEFIVRVPQLIAEFGEDAIARLVPSLYNYYMAYVETCRVTAAVDRRFDEVRIRVDDTELDKAVAASPPARPAVGEQWVDSHGIDPESIATSVVREWIMHDPTSTREPKAAGTTILASPDHIQPSPKASAKYEAVKAELRAALAEAIRDGAFPPRVTTDVLRKLEKSLTWCRSTSRRGLKTAVRDAVAKWSLDAKLVYYEMRLKSDQEMTSREIAEAVVLKSEARGRGQGDFTGHDHPDVNAEKHAESIEQLAEEVRSTLKTPRTGRQWRGRVKKASKKMAGSREKGFYQKQGLLRDKDHVSVDVDNARRTWKRQLAKLT